MGTWTINPDDLAATRTGLGLGTAATVNTGTTNGNVPLVGSDGKLAGAVLPPSGGSIDLTASGAITAGKTLVLNTNGTVSEIAVTGISEIIGSAFTPTNETASGDGRVIYMTTPDRFLVASSSTISGTTKNRARVLDLSSSMGITETTVGDMVANMIFSLDYSATHDRVVVHQQNTSPHGVGVYTISYSSSNGLDIDGVTNAHSSNLPYGSTRFIGASDNTLISVFSSSSPATLYGKFWTLTTGSDASGDSLSGGSDFDVGITAGSETYHHYFTPVWFSGPSRLLIMKSGYHSGTDYRPRLTHGSISGTGSSTAYSETGEANWSDSDMFLESGKLRYDAGLDRACWWDGQYLRTISLTGGYAQSALKTIQTTHPGSTVPGQAVGVIPGTNYICLFAGDDANSNRLSMWVVTITKGSDASGDTFSAASPVQISTDSIYYYLDCDWSPDAGGFLLYSQLNSAASKTYGIRPNQSSTNVTASNFIGFAESSVGDGATVTVQLPGATASPAQGSLTAGTTYYVSNSGAIQTSDAGYGKAGRAVSSTKLIIEERA